MDAHEKARRGYGDKNTTALEKIKHASPSGITTDELYPMMVVTADLQFPERENRG